MIRLPQLGIGSKTATSPQTHEWCSLMTSSERVRKVLSGEMPDRVPTGEFAIDFDTVEKIIGHETYLRAKAKSKMAFWDGRHDEVMESYINDHIELHEKLDLDIVNFPMATWAIPAPTDDKPPRRVNENTWEDKYGRVFKLSEITADVVCVEDPTAQQNLYTMDSEVMASVEEALANQPDQAKPSLDERSWRVLDQVMDHFADDKFLIGPSGGEVGIVLRGTMEQGMMALVSQKDLIAKAVQYLVEKQNRLDSIMIRPQADAVIWGADFAFKSGGFIGPDMFRELFFDANKARVDNVKSHGKFVIKHCCGNLNRWLDMFVELGYDCYQSIQHSAGMDLAQVKKRIGAVMTLWGGVNVENIIGGSMEDVREDVRQAMKAAKKGGRFILGTTHTIAVGSNYDNYMAMLDEYRKLADY